MKAKLLLLCLLPFTYLLPAKIAVVGAEKNDTYITPFLKEHLEPLGHEVECIWKGANFDEYEIIVCGNYKSFLEKYKKKVILSLFEPPVYLKPHGQLKKLQGHLCVFTWNHIQCNGKDFRKFYYPCGHIKHSNDLTLFPFKQKKLACLINSELKNSHPEELYSVRRNVAKYYNKYHPDSFSLYGFRGWKSGYKPVFKGPTQNKHLVLKEHKFNYCFENWNNNTHYISEKIFDAFNALCVPIYLGSSKIEDFIPSNTFIDARKFSSIEHLHEYISSMGEETYLTYIDAIIQFSDDPILEKFSPKYHRDQVLEKILEHL